MASNETRCDRIEERLEALIVEVARRGEMRDADIAGLTARLTGAETSIEIAAAEAKPGWTGILIALAAAFGILAAIGQSFLRPLESEVDNLKDWRNEQRKEVQSLHMRTDQVEEKTDTMRGELDQIEKQVDAVDSHGSRNGVK